MKEPMSVIKNYLAKNNFPAQLFVLGLFIIYSPVFFIEYAFLNDFAIFDFSIREHPHRGCCFTWPESVMLFLLGRPVQAIMVNYAIMPISTMSDLQLGRFLGFIAVLLSLWLFGAILKRTTSLKYGEILAILFLVAILPGMQVFIFWFLNAFAGPTSFILSLLAAYLFLIDRNRNLVQRPLTNWPRMEKSNMAKSLRNAYSIKKTGE